MVSLTQMSYYVRFTLEALDAGQRSTKVYYAEKALTNSTRSISEKCKIQTVDKLNTEKNKIIDKKANKLGMIKGFLKQQKKALLYPAGTNEPISAKLLHLSVSKVNFCGIP